MSILFMSSLILEATIMSFFPFTTITFGAFGCPIRIGMIFWQWFEAVDAIIHDILPHYYTLFARGVLTSKWSNVTPLFGLFPSCPYFVTDAVRARLCQWLFAVTTEFSHR